MKKIKKLILLAFVFAVGFAMFNLDKTYAKDKEEFNTIDEYYSSFSWKRNKTGWWLEQSDGFYPTNEWIKVNNVWYYTENSGYISLEEWAFINNKWYYFDKSGAMVYNKWIWHYYLGHDGAMVVNTSTPDGYVVDKKGKWDGKAKNSKLIRKVPNPVDPIKKIVLKKKSSVKNSHGVLVEADYTEIMDMVNKYRTANGKGELRVNKDLRPLANTRAYELTYKWGHTRPDGTVLRRNKNIGEIIYWQWREGGASAVNWWKNSPVHNNELLDGRYKSFNVGICKNSNGNFYYVILFSYN